MPTLAVVMPTYKHAHLLPRALDAIISQSRVPDELIVINDASPDDTDSVLASYAKRLPSMVVIKNPVNMGVVASMNVGIKAARSDFVYLAASDDRVMPDFLASATRLLENHPEAGVLCAKMAMVADGLRTHVFGVSRWKESGYRSPAQFVDDWLFGELPGFSLGAATIFHREKLNEAGGFRMEMASWTDTFACFALALKHGICYLDAVATECTVLPESYSAQTSRNVESLQRTLATGAALMRSPEFRDRFPEKYVVRWELFWRLDILNEIDLVRDVLVRRRVPELRQAYTDMAKTANPFDRFMGFLIRMFLFLADGKMQRAIWRRFIDRRLRKQ